MGVWLKRRKLGLEPLGLRTLESGVRPGVGRSEKRGNGCFPRYVCLAPINYLHLSSDRPWWHVTQVTGWGT